MAALVHALSFCLPSPAGALAVNMRTMLLPQRPLGQGPLQPADPGMDAAESWRSGAAVPQTLRGSCLCRNDPALCCLLAGIGKPGRIICCLREHACRTFPVLCLCRQQSIVEHAEIAILDLHVGMHAGASRHHRALLQQLSSGARSRSKPPLEAIHEEGGIPAASSSDSVSSSPSDGAGRPKGEPACVADSEPNSAVMATTGSKASHTAFSDFGTKPPPS